MRLRATTKIRNDTLISTREKLGLSQRDFAKKMGIPESYIFRLEKLDYRWAIPEDVVLKYYQNKYTPQSLKVKK